jgi:hypothetical protein
VANPTTWRSRKRGGLIALMFLSVAGAAVGVSLHPSPTYRARAVIAPGRVPAIASHARVEDAKLLAGIAVWPGVVEDARKEAHSDISETEVRAGLGASVSSAGAIEIETRGPSYPSAAAFANRLAGRVTQLGRISEVRAGAGLLALGDFGIGAFAAPPKHIVLVNNDPRYRPALEVICTAAVGCGAGSTLTFPFRTGRAYTVSAWVRSRTRAPTRLTVALGHDAQDVKTDFPQMVGSNWTELSVSWTPESDLGSTSVSVQTARAAAASFEIGEVTIENAGRPRMPLFGSLPHAAVQRLLVAARLARVIAASPADETSTTARLWAAIAALCGLLALSCAFLLRPVNRGGQSHAPARWGPQLLRPRAGAVAAMIGGLLLVALPAAAAPRYPGSVFSFLLFQVSYSALLLLAIPRPRRYAYTALAILLFLGFWAKFNIHSIFDYAFQEPIGSFDSSGKSWDRAMTVASAAAIGVVLARLAQLAWDRRRDRAQSRTVTPPGCRTFRIPGWYPSHRRSFWLGTAAVGIALAAANATGAFYETGVDPRIMLPLHLNVLIGWGVELGVALWIAMLIHWEEMATSESPGRALMAPLIEAPVTTVSALSRGIYLFHLLPYGLVLLDDRQDLWRKLSGRRLGALAALTLIGFVLSLGATSALRLAVYPQAAPIPTGSAPTLDVQQRVAAATSRSTEPTSRTTTDSPRLPAARVFNLAVVAASRFGSQRVAFMVHQVFTLFTDRWTGLEGVMAVSSHKKLGWSLLSSALEESPGTGQHAKYQLIAGANLVYANYPGFTFLSLPGVVGILDYSGSLLVVLLGMALITSVLLTLEWLTLHFTSNPYLAAVTGVAFANELAEASFPYLVGTFFVLLIASLACIATLYAWQTPTGRGARVAPEHPHQARVERGL